MTGNWITGYIDGEGSFHIGIRKRNKIKVGLEISLSFSITQKSREKETLERIQKYFGCGGMKYSKRDGCYIYSIKAISDLKILLKHFEKYPLETTKKERYEIFKEVYYKVLNNEHKNAEVLRDIVERSYAMNKSGKRKQTKEFYLKQIKGKEV